MKFPTLAVVSSLLSLVAAFFTNDAKPPVVENRVENSAEKANGGQGIVLPRFLKKLDLTQKQKSQIEATISKFDRQSEKLWRTFNREHWQAVQLEASYVVAQKMSDHHHKAATKSAKTTRKPATVTGVTTQETQKTRKETKKAELDVIAMRLLVAGPNGKVKEYQLSRPKHDGEKVCKVCERQRNRLAKAWKEVHAAHRKIVANEAAKMMAIENVLTKQQRKKLFGQRPKHDSVSDSAK